MSSSWHWCGLCACVAVAAAQEPARRALVGRVTDPAGAPVDGASVVLVGMQTGRAAFGADDVVMTTTDGRGRFLAKALPGLPYCAFAARAAAAGPAVASPLCGWFGVGAVLDLEVEERAANLSLPMQVGGLEAYAARGPLRCVARATMGDSYLPMPFALDWPGPMNEPTPWPALPIGTVELQDANGAFLFSLVAPSPRRSQFDLPPPRDVRLAVADDNGAPIAGAEIFVRTGVWHDAGVDGIATQRLALQHLVARTDADGKAVVQIPDPGPIGGWPAHLFVARAPGRIETVSGGRGNDRYENDRRVGRPADDTVRFRLVRVEARAGRIEALPPTKEPWSAVLRVTAKLQSGPAGFLHDPRAYAVALAADGTYAIEHAPTDVHASQWIVQRSAMTPPLLFAPQSAGKSIEPPPAELPSRLSIAVLDASAGPCSGRAVYLVRKDSEERGHDGRIRLVVDAGGRAEVDVAPGTWIVQCLEAGGLARTEVDATTRSEVAVELRLTPFATETGTVRTADGSPVAGARFRVRASTGRCGDRLLSEWAGRGIRRQLAKVRSAADGSFTVPAAIFAEQRLVLRAELGELHSEDFEPTVARDRPLVLVLK